MADTLNFDKLVIDRVVDAWFEDKKSHDLLAVLDQISSLSISTSSETKDKTDAQGNLIKRYFTSKSVEVTGENAVVSLNLMAIQTGMKNGVLTGTDVTAVPRILQVAKPVNPTSGIVLPDVPIGISTESEDDDTLVVYGTFENGLVDISKKYVKGDTAGAGTYAISVEQGVATIVLPTDATASVQIKYEYDITGDKLAARVDQDGKSFPKECKATFRVLCSDICQTDVTRALYIVFPAFQMSPDFDWDISTDATQSFSATALKDYCDKKQLLFYVALAEDSDEYDAIINEDQTFNG